MKNYFKDNLSLEESIIATLSFFSTMDRPLSFDEISKYLWRNKAQEQNIHEILTKLLLQKKLKAERYNKFIYYYLNSDTNYLERFKKRTKFRTRLLKRAKFITIFLKLIPFLKTVYICNSLSFQASKKSSDIDLFIITKKNKLFITRLLITFVVSILGLRRHGKNIQAKICLSFFTEEDNINLKKIAIIDDIYLIYWIANLKLIYGENNKEIIENNNWLYYYLPNIKQVEKIKTFKEPLTGLIQYFFEIILQITFLGIILNFILRIWQKDRANKKLQKLDKNASNIISNKMLKFHNKDKRQEYLEKWTKMIEIFKD